MNVLGELRFRLGSFRQARYLHQEIARLQRELERTRTRAPSVKPENLIWLFSSPRSGSSWLSRMLQDMPSSAWWNEPDVGRLFGAFYQDWRGKASREGFILADDHRESYLKGIRALVLDGARSRYVHNGKAPQNIVVKEPNGSVGAPLLSATMPKSRMILLRRDPRDVLASMLEASKEGNWLYTRPVHAGADWREANEADVDPVGHLRRRANEYMDVMPKALQAYNEHPGPKISVSYERLLEDPVSELEKITSALSIKVSREQLEEIVEERSFENVSEEAKGYGKAIRKGQAESWREDLTGEQIAEVERITAPLMDELGYERVT